MDEIDGNSKTERGEFGAISSRPRKFLVIDDNLLGGTENCYAIIYKYYAFRLATTETFDNFSGNQIMPGRTREKCVFVFLAAEYRQEKGLKRCEKNTEKWVLQEMVHTAPPLQISC